jgi:GYF domain 2
MIKRMAEEWFIRVHGKDYGPADFETLQEWKADGRVIPANPARRADVDLWSTAAEIPGLFGREQPPVQSEPAQEWSTVTDQKTQRAPRRNLLTDTFRIYFRGFFQFLGLALLGIVPVVCAEFTSRFIDTAPEVNVDLRTLVAGLFTMSMFGLRLVLIPVYIAGIQILTAELATGGRIGFFSALNGAVKFWPRVAGVCIFVYVIFVLIIAFGLLVLSMTLAASLSGSLVWIMVALGLSALQIWCFCRFFVFTLFWQQFAVLENLPAFESLQQSGTLAHSGRDLPWYQRPLWRGSMVVSVWIVFIAGVGLIAVWPRLVAEWPLVQDYWNQLVQSQDPQAVLQKINASLQSSHGFDSRALILNIAERIFQPLLGIAFVLLYLDSKPGAD